MATIPALFSRTAAQFGSRAALIEPSDEGEIVTLTYQDVLERARSFAGYLQQQSLQKGDCLIIWSSSRISWLITYLGTLMVGIVVVPLDVNSKADFLQHIVEITGAKLVVTTQKQYSSLKRTTVSFIDIANLPEASLDMERLPLIDEGELAELVFTSGTTGQPKGVMLSHHNITSNAESALQVVRITANDRALSILPLSHMFELTIEVALLSIGASIVYARSLSPDTLFKLLASQHITCMVLVPQALQLFMNGIEREVRRQKREALWSILHRLATFTPFRLRPLLFGMIHRRFGGHFRLFVSGGAYLLPSLAQRWENMGFRVLQGYGTTECSPVISATPMNDHNYTSVGKPLPGVAVRINGDNEILVCGPNVALGYWKNEAATAEAFKDGWYYTSDLGYMDKDQNLYLKGRKKNLIVLANGLNVYPEDVENALQADTRLREAIVLGIDKNQQGPEVHAVLLMENPEQAKQVVQQANKQLASHQQIRSYTIWPEPDFPRTHTLKVRRSEVQRHLQTPQTTS